jgi:hypothetical protein
LKEISLKTHLKILGWHAEFLEGMRRWRDEEIADLDWHGSPGRNSSAVLCHPTA